MTIQAYPVKIEDGVVRTIDGSPLPEHGNAVLVILPETPASSGSLEEWQRPFEAYFAAWRADPPKTNIDEVSDKDLNRIVHETRASLKS